MIFLKKYKKYISQRYSLDLIRNELKHICNDDDDFIYVYHSTNHFLIHTIEGGYKIYTLDEHITIDSYKGHQIIIDKYTNNIRCITLRYNRNQLVIFARHDNYDSNINNVYKISIDIRAANIYVNKQYHKNMLHNTSQVNFYMKDLDFRIKHKFPQYSLGIM